MQEDTEKHENLHPSRVEGEAKAGGEEIVEDHHFVRMRLRRSLPDRGACVKLTQRMPDLSNSSITTWVM